MKYYVVKGMFGEYDESWESTFFITDSESIATKYCEKANAILTRYKDYYKDLLQLASDESHERSADYIHISERVNVTGGHYYLNGIEFRTDNL